MTLNLDEATFARLDALRQAHFPPERNFLSAHITLFHALPSDQEEAIRQTLQRITVESPLLLDLRRQLATTWHDWLGAQDRQHYQPHVTVQNKVTVASGAPTIRAIDYSLAHLYRAWRRAVSLALPRRSMGICSRISILAVDDPAS